MKWRIPWAPFRTALLEKAKKNHEKYYTVKIYIPFTKLQGCLSRIYISAEEEKPEGLCDAESITTYTAKGSVR
jgi:hypothetical protein